MTTVDAPSQVTPPLQLDRIDVEGLFGSRAIPDLRLDPDVTILTGENGSGKSTILNAIDYIGRRVWDSLAALPIEAIHLSFSDGRRVSAEISPAGLIVHDGRNRPYEPPVQRAARGSTAPDDYESTRLVEEIERTTDPARRQFLIARYRQFMESGKDPDEPEWLTDILTRFSPTLVSARRLEETQVRARGRPRDAPRPKAVVDQYATEIADRVRLELAGWESRREERTLAPRIVQAMVSAAEEDPADVAQQVRALRDQVAELSLRLASVGLVEPEPEPVQYEESYDVQVLRAVREVYAVTLARLERLNPFLELLEAFTRFIDERFSGKRLQLNRRSGIAIELERDSGTIRPSQLSSGEQQLLVVAYKLLFEAEEGSLVLVDEPEISLHISWQQHLIDGLLDLGRPRGLRYLIATHSTSVLARHPDRERSLDELTHESPLAQNS